MRSSDKTQALSTMSTRQKVTAVVFLIIVIVVIWQLISLMGGGSTPPVVKSSKQPTAQNGNMQAQGPNPVQQMSIPKPAELPKPNPAPTDPRLAEMQQQMEDKYISAITELQILKINREIAEANQAIMTAKLATVTAQKGIVTLLAPTPITQETYSKTLVNPTGTGTGANAAPPPANTAVKYTVISVTQLQNTWGAVIGANGQLYNVQIGDVLPPDGSTVEAIDNSGVVLTDKTGQKNKLSLVPII